MKRPACKVTVREEDFVEILTFSFGDKSYELILDDNPRVLYARALKIFREMDEWAEKHALDT